MIVVVFDTNDIISAIYPVLATALAARARYVVAGDRD